MQIDVAQALPNYLAQHENPHEILLGAIKLSVQHRGCYLDDEAKIVKKVTGHERGASSEKIVAIFNRVLVDRKEGQLSDLFIDEAKKWVFAYIDAEIGVTTSKKAQIKEGFISVVEMPLRSRHPLQHLEKIINQAQAGKYIYQFDKTHVGISLSTMALERAFLLKLSLLIYSFYVFTRFAQEMQKRYSLYLEEENETAFDWNQFRGAGDVEEFSRNFCLGHLRVHDRERCWELLHIIDKPAVWEKWLPILAIDSVFVAMKAFDFSMAEFKAIFSSISQEVNQLKATCGKIFAYLDTRENSDYSLRAIIKDASIFAEASQIIKRYNSSQERLDAIYRQAYEILGQFSDDEKISQPEHPFQKEPPTPDAFSSVKMPAIEKYVPLAMEPESLFSYEDFHPKQLLSLAESALLELCEQPKFTSADIYRAFDRQAKLLKKIQQLAVGESTEKRAEPKRKAKKLSKGKTETIVAPEVVEAIPTHIEPDTGPAWQLVPLAIAYRVRDWYQKHPLIVQKEPYLNLSLEQIEEAKFLHTYPMVITKLMRHLFTPEEWQSATRKRVNNSYTAAGTIERYGQKLPPIEGYFSDCFDGQTGELYHHFFHVRNFRQILLSYIQSGQFLEEPIENDLLAPNTNSEEIEHKRRYTVIKRSFTIEIDDTQKAVRYTLCLIKSLGRGARGS